MKPAEKKQYERIFSAVRENKVFNVIKQQASTLRVRKREN